MAKAPKIPSVDRAASLSGVEIGLDSAPHFRGGDVGNDAETRTRGGVKTYPGGRGVVPDTAGQPNAPAQPVPAPVPPATLVRPDAATFGLSGTPITSGFLRVLEEANQHLYGRNGVRTYYEMLVGDAQVRATIAACSLPVMSAKWDVIPADVSRQTGEKKKASSTGAGAVNSAKAAEVARFVKENLFGGLEFQDSRGGWHSQSWSSVIQNALDMLAFGCAVHEDVWRIDQDAIRMRQLAARQPITFYRWLTEPDGETLLALEQYGYRRDQFKNAPLPSDKIAVFTYQQKGANFWGIPLTRVMFPHWRYKWGLYRVEAIAGERNTLGVPVYRLTPGYSKEDWQAAFNMVTQVSAHERTGFVEPPGTQYDGLRIVGIQGRTRDNLPFILHQNRMISTAALAQMLELGQEGKGGSRALGQSSSKFFLLSEQALADQIAETITNTTIRRLVYWNFGEGAPAPRLVAANVQARSLEDITDALTAFATAGLVVSEQEVRDFIRQELALPEESRRGIVAIRGEAIDAEKGAAEGPIMGKGAAVQPGEGAPANGPQPESAGSRPPGSKADGGKQQSSAAGHAGAVTLSAASTPRKRESISPYWHAPVASTETHVDWREVQANPDRAAVALRKALGKAKIGVIQRVARQYAEQLAAGKRPSEVTLAHDQQADDAITPILAATYHAARGHVRDEVKRLRIAKHGRDLAIPALPPAERARAGFLADARNDGGHAGALRFAQGDTDGGAADEAGSLPPPELVADGVIQKLVNRYGASAASMASDLGGREPDEEEIAAGLNGLSDGYLDELAGQGARQSAAYGRFDELAAVDDEIQANGGRYERSEILDQNTCAACAAGDGRGWDSFDEIDWQPGDDCEGGDNCRGTVIAVFG